MNETPQRRAVYDLTITYEDTPDGHEALQEFIKFIVTGFYALQEDTQPQWELLDIDLDYDADTSEWASESLQEQLQ